MYEMIFIWIMFGIIGIFWILNLNLLILHMYLVYKGLTTFEWLFPKSIPHGTGRIDVKISKKI